MLPGKELTVEEAREELTGMVQKQKATVEKSKVEELSFEQKKALEEEKKRKEELQKQDEEILKKKPEELKDEEKKRKEEILEGQKTEEEQKARKLSPEDKIKRVEEKAQKRIDEVISKLKQVEDSSSKEAKELRKELDTLREEKNNLEKKISETLPSDDKSTIKKAEAERIAKYIEEDKDLPKEERRELPREELEQWLIEDYVAAQEWLVERNMRRKEEKREVIDKGKVEDLQKLQADSVKKVATKHPELADTKQIESRLAELRKDGKSDKEIGETLFKEFPKNVISLQIVREWQKSKPEALRSPNAPELVAEEMERRISGVKSQESKDSKIEALEKQIEEMRAELSKLSNEDEGVSSTVARKRPATQSSESEKTLMDVMKDVKLPKDKMDAVLNKFRKAKGNA